jgi:hypothetical protein
MNAKIQLRRLADPVRGAMLAMAAALVAFALFFTSSSALADVRLDVVAFTAISAVLFYVLPALFVDDVGKPYMDAATAASIALAAVSLMEAYLVAASRNPLVMVAAPLPPLAAGFAVCLAGPPKTFNALAVDLAVFGFLAFMVPSAAAFAGYRIFFTVFALLTAIGYLGYIYTLLDLYPSC